MIRLASQFLQHAAYISRGVAFNSLESAEAGSLPPVGAQVRCANYYSSLKGEKVIEALIAGETKSAYRILNFYRKHRSLDYEHLNPALADGLLNRLLHKARAGEPNFKRLLPANLRKADISESVSEIEILRNFGLLHIHSYNDLVKVWRTIKDHTEEKVTQRYQQRYRLDLWKHEQNVSSIIEDRYQGSFNPTELSCRGFQARSLFRFAMEAKIKIAFFTDLLEHYQLRDDHKFISKVRQKYIFNESLNFHDFVRAITKVFEELKSRSENKDSGTNGEVGETEINATPADAFSTLQAPPVKTPKSSKTLPERNALAGSMKTQQKTVPPAATRQTKRERLLERLGEFTESRKLERTQHKYEVHFPVTSEGHKNRYLKELPSIMQEDQVMIEAAVARLENYTPGKIAKGWKSLEQGVFQMRLTGLAKEYRVYFVVIGQQVNVLDLYVKRDSLTLQKRLIARVLSDASALKRQ